MLRRIVTLLAVAAAFEVMSAKAILAQSGSRTAPTYDPELVRSARSRVTNWPKLGMWLPDKDVPFFRQNFAAVESVLQNALADPDEKIRQPAAYVVTEIGPVASSLEPALVQRIETDPSRLIRMYLYSAAGSIGAQSPKMLAVLRTRFAALEKEPDVRAHPGEYMATDERIEVASALLHIDNSPARKTQYGEFLLHWLKPAPAGVSGAKLEEYWDHRWVAVTVIENTGSPREAVPLLRAMLKEPRRKGWVYMKASRALDALERTPFQKTTASPKGS
jgi:hypothetical protein